MASLDEGDLVFPQSLAFNPVCEGVVVRGNRTQYLCTWLEDVVEVHDAGRVSMTALKALEAWADEWIPLDGSAHSQATARH